MEARPELALGAAEIAGTRGQVRAGQAQDAPIVRFGGRRAGLEPTEVPLQGKRFQVQPHVLVKHREPVGPIAEGNDRRLLPEVFDQAASLIEPPLLSQQDQEQVPQGGDLDPGTFQARAQDPLRLGNPAQGNRHLSELQGRRGGPRRIGRNVGPGVQRGRGLAPRHLATSELESDLSLLRPLLRQPGQPIPGHRHQPGFHFSPRLGQLAPEALTGQQPRSDPAQDGQDREEDHDDENLPSTHTPRFTGLGRTDSGPGPRLSTIHWPGFIIAIPPHALDDLPGGSSHPAAGPRSLTSSTISLGVRPRQRLTKPSRVLALAGGYSR